MPSPRSDHAERMQRVRLCLEGLSLGDAFGERFIVRESWAKGPAPRQLPPSPWKYTDDTEMALVIAKVLDSEGCIEQDLLAAEFASRYALDPYRGYGAGAHELLSRIAQGIPWRQAAGALFDGQGSLGNGSAMRVSPVGAYFAGDGYAEVTRQARLSAEVTHAHPEGIAGTIAVAAAAAWTARRTVQSGTVLPLDLFHTVLTYTPEGRTRAGIMRAAGLPLDAWQFHAAEQLGNGSMVSAFDTVPFCLWMAARHLDDLTEALWSTVYVGGDIDTNCAIVGGIVALSVGYSGLRAEWLKSREPLAW